jgi:hypothetical protein
MDIENDLPLELPADPQPVTITPLSFFFPTITDDEAQKIDGESVRIMERRTRVMDLYRRGRSMDTIRKELGCSLGTVHADLHAVLDGYRKIAARSAQEHIAAMIQLLVHREAQIEADLDRSRGSSQERITSRRDGGTGQTGSATIKTRTKYGDPRLHALLQGYWDRRCKLFGLLKLDDARNQTPPTVKLVAGIDPQELV